MVKNLLAHVAVYFLLPFVLLFCVKQAQNALNRRFGARDAQTRLTVLHVIPPADFGPMKRGCHTLPTTFFHFIQFLSSVPVWTFTPHTSTLDGLFDNPLPVSLRDFRTPSVSAPITGTFQSFEWEFGDSHTIMTSVYLIVTQVELKFNSSLKG